VSDHEDSDKEVCYCEVLDVVFERLECDFSDIFGLQVLNHGVFSFFRRIRF